MHDHSPTWSSLLPALQRNANRSAPLLSTIALCAMLAGAVPSLAIAKAGETGYALGPQDRVRVTVVEWFAGTGEIRSPVNGEYTISPTGVVSLPLIGDVPAASLEPPALADEISSRLQAKLGLTERPVTSIEILQFRPLFVMGDVERPGEFTYRPGLTVLRAAGLAGGFVRISPAALAQAEREAAQAAADERTIVARLVALDARKARLSAEFAEAATVTFPPELLARNAEPAVRDALKLEEALFDSRRSALATNLSTQGNLIDLYAKEVAAIQGQAASLKRHEEATQRQGENLRSLQARGLATLGREFDIDRLLAEVTMRKQDLDARAVRLQQERVRAEDSIQKAKSERRQEIASELQALQASADDLAQRLDIARRTRAEAEQTARRMETRSFTILRQRAADAEDVELQATASTLLKPGDVLIVRTASADAATSAIERQVVNGKSERIADVQPEPSMTRTGAQAVR
jgi:exopolysaccharide production protein ExoF